MAQLIPIRSAARNLARRRLRHARPAVRARPPAVILPFRRPSTARDFILACVLPAQPPSR